jgi:hypothetical protein
MNKANFFKQILQRFNFWKRSPRASGTSAQSNEMLDKLLQMVNDTDEVEISCDDVMALLDQYVELEARGEDVAHLLPLVKKHLDRCRDCHEEYEALVRIFAASSS